MKGAFTIMLSLFFYFFSYSQNSGYDISNWKVHDFPTHKDTLLKYNWVKTRWYLNKVGKNVYAKSYEDFRQESKLPFELKPLTGKEKYEFRGEISYFKVDTGYLVSFYNGEFGGALYWFDDTGNTKLRLGYAMIKAFITLQNKIFALNGLNHMGLSYGSILELRKENGEWKQFEYLALPEAARAICLDEHDRFIVATDDKVLLINTDKKIDTILVKQGWDLLNPTSIVVVEKNLYVGMQQGVYKYDLEERREEWLMKD